jgi:hypothetical protein
VKFSNVNGTTTAPLAAAHSSAGTPASTSTAARSRRAELSVAHLDQWFSADRHSGNVERRGGNLDLGNTLRLNITGLASGAARTAAIGHNREQLNVAGSPATFVDSGAALFDDTAAGTTNVTPMALFSHERHC